MQNHQQHLTSPTLFDFGNTNSSNNSSFHQQFRYSNTAVANNLSEEEDPLPLFEEFQGIIDDYLHNLSPKKRDKALVDHARYCLILEVLKNPRNTSISTAQFRFWVKKMFQLQPGSYDLVCHDNKPVAMREQIYDILVNAHKEAHHGGRDKTSAIVRNQFSWIPKELVARFVRQCPTCISRRNGSQSLSAYTSKASSPRIDYPYDIAAVAAAAAGVAISASTPTLLYTPSSKAESDISTSPSTTTDRYHNFKRSPISHYHVTSPSPSNKRPFFAQDGLFDSIGGDHYTHLDYPVQPSPSIISSRSPPYYRRRPSAPLPMPPQSTQQTQPDFMNYSTFTDNNTPSYYKAMINAYQSQSLLDSTTDINNAIGTDFTSGTAATVAIDPTCGVLSHNTNTPSPL